MPLVAPKQQTTRTLPYPAPTAGIEVNIPMYGESGAEAAALWLYNMIPGEFGCRVRKGSREFATNVLNELGEPGEVRTLVLYNSVVAGGADDVFFATTQNGIYDITAGGAGPHPLSLEWSSKGARAGWCSVVNYTNVGGDHFLLVCDEENGYYIYDGTTWSQGSFTGSPTPEPEDLVHITEWNGRIWFVERDTARSWFLDPLALTGDITEFDVGNRFLKGGHLVQNTTWTLDDGAGMDDLFVQVSSAGDVLVWNGVDPTTASDMTLRGRWTLGAVPEGRRVLSNWGGDVSIVGTTGIIQLSSLVIGQGSVNNEQFITNRITRQFQIEMERKRDYYGWSMALVPGEGLALISVPLDPAKSEAPIQFVLNTVEKTWCIFRDLDMLCMDKNINGFFFGTHDGRVMEFTGTVDDVPLDGSEGYPIVFSLLSHYSPLGQPGVWKRPQFVRPYWLANAQPSYSLQMRYDYDIAELTTTPPFTMVDASLWDAAIWDTDTWQGAAQGYNEVIGVSGMGHTVSIAIRGQSTVETAYIGADLMCECGGML